MKFIITESQYRTLQEQRVKGEQVSPEKYVAHTSNPINRDNISKTGLQVSLGECYLIYADSNYGEDEECVPAVFATNSIKKKDLFDSTYDDDIWVIDTEIAGVQWYNDAHFEGGDYKHIVTFEDIPVEAIRLVYKGTGRDSWGTHKDETELTLTESLEDELIDNHLKKYIDSGCVKIKKTPNYISIDVESPSYFNEFGFNDIDSVKIKNLLKKHSFQYAFGEYIKKI